MATMSLNTHLCIHYVSRPTRCLSKLLLYANSLSLRFGLDWYDTLSIPDKYDVIYVVVVQYIKWRDRHHKFIQPKVLVLDEVMRDWDNYDVVSFGSAKTPTDDMYVIDEAFVVQHPEIIDPKHRGRLLKMYATST